MQNNLVHIEEVRHSNRGASSAYRWRKCKGSLNLIDRIQKDGKKLRTSGEPAAEGTVAHTVFAAAMDEGTDGHEFLDMQFSAGGWTFVVDEEMADGVQLMLDLVRSIASEDQDSVVYIEKPLDSLTDDDAYGTPDAIIWMPTKKRLVVVDLKYGAGLICEPDSDQTKYYGYLGVENYIDTTSGNEIAVELCIVQPRIPHPAGTVRFHKMTSDEIEDWWFKELLPDMKATRDPNAMLLIGEHCRFCPAKLSCPALKQETFDMVVDVDPCHMTTAEINEVMGKKTAIEKFLESVAGEAFRRGLDGERIAGYKIVKKQSKRISKSTIVDDDGNILEFETEAVKTFGMDAYEDAKLKSIAQLEKNEGGRSFVSKWAFMPDNGLTMAPDSDKRQSVLRLIDRLTVDDIV